MIGSMALRAFALSCLLAAPAWSEDVRQVQQEMLQRIESFDQQLDALQQTAQKQMDFLVHAEQQASNEDQKQQIETQIGALQLEMQDMAKKRQNLEEQIGKARNAMADVNQDNHQGDLAQGR